MARIPFNVPPTPSEAERGWITFAEAVRWIVIALGFPGDNEVLWFEDYSGTAEHREAKAQLRNALGRGDVKAFGDLGHNQHIEIPAIEWSTREVRDIDSKIFNAPYERFWVPRAVIEERWSPVPRSSAKSRGRPPKHDWDWVLRRARDIVSSKPDISKGSLALSLQSEYETVFGFSFDCRDCEKRLTGWGLPRGDK